MSLKVIPGEILPRSIRAVIEPAHRLYSCTMTVNSLKSKTA